jgi:hypothetical protein
MSERTDRHRGKTGLDAQAEYARVNALVHLRLAELREALEQHESERSNWTRTGTLRQVDGLLGRAVSFVKDRRR